MKYQNNILEQNTLVVLAPCLGNNNKEIVKNSGGIVHREEKKTYVHRTCTHLQRAWEYGHRTASVQNVANARRSYVVSTCLATYLPRAQRTMHAASHDHCVPCGPRTYNVRTPYVPYFFFYLLYVLCTFSEKRSGRSLQKNAEHVEHARWVVTKALAFTFDYGDY